MKPQILSFLLLGALVSSAHSQNAAPAANAQARQNAQEASGYAQLVEAAQLIIPGENGSPSAAETLAPDENLRLQREAVKCNAPALALMREALQKPVFAPTDSVSTDGVSPHGVSNGGKFRELARQLMQESDVRLADGDALGALNSRLDCLELGVAVSRGPLISMLIGTAIESIGRNGIAPIAAKLDAAQSRVAASRISQIEVRRPNFAQILRLDAAENLRSALLALPNEKTRAADQTTEGDKTEKMSAKPARAALALTPEQLRADNARLYNVAIGAARIAPHYAAMVPLPSDLNSVTNGERDLLSRPDLRFIYERQVAQNRLLLSALELHAQKLENGSYPAQFDATRDPFLPENPLIYRLNGDSYQLYSVGPDARDNRGQALSSQRSQFDLDSGESRAVKIKNLGAGDKGDIVAPVL